VTIEFPKSKCRGKCLGKGTCYNKDNESTQCPDCKGSGKLLQSINYKDNIQPKATWGKLFTAYQQIFDADVPFNDADDSRATEIFKRYGLATIAGVVVVGAWYLLAPAGAIGAIGVQIQTIYTSASAGVLEYLGLTTKTAAASAQATAVGTATKTATDAAIIAQKTAVDAAIEKAALAAKEAVTGLTLTDKFYHMLKFVPDSLKALYVRRRRLATDRRRLPVMERLLDTIRESPASRPRRGWRQSRRLATAKRLKTLLSKPRSCLAGPLPREP